MLRTYKAIVRTNHTCIQVINLGTFSALQSSLDKDSSLKFLSESIINIVPEVSFMIITKIRTCMDCFGARGII